MIMKNGSLEEHLPTFSRPTLLKWVQPSRVAYVAVFTEIYCVYLQRLLYPKDMDIEGCSNSVKNGGDSESAFFNVLLFSFYCLKGIASCLLTYGPILWLVWKTLVLLSTNKVFLFNNKTIKRLYCVLNQMWLHKPVKKRSGMETEEFRRRGKEMVDYMCDYMNTLGERRVTSEVQPNYLRRLLPAEAPCDPEPWEDIMQDVEHKIMPGVTHWQHPRFHAYFPSGNSYPSILGDMLSDIIGCIGFSWAASPACTELETIVLDWLGRAICLPHTFLSQSNGGGVIQGSASECILVCMLAARAQALSKLREVDPSVAEAFHLPKLVAYCSREAHSCVEKAAIICLVQLRILEPDRENSLTGEILEKAMEEDKGNGLVPFFVAAISGSTGSCSFDKLNELGELTSENDCWLHIDAAYAGSAMICPEFQHLIQGIDLADSFNLNPNKWLLTNFDCSCLWVKDRRKLTNALNVNPLYLMHENEEKVFDYRHWGIPLSRRFRSLKLWFVLRTFGVTGIQKYIRNHVKLADRFKEHVTKDKRFEVLNKVVMGLVCFRLRSDGDNLTAELLANINHSGKLHMIPARIKDKYIIRFCVVNQHATEADIDTAWKIISDFATELLKDEKSPLTPIDLSTAEGRKQMETHSFSLSLPPDVTKALRPSLYDGATPVVLPQNITDNKNNIFDDVFKSALKKYTSN